jgi:hypothetical protein
MKYHFWNHFNKTLVNTHQVEYIYMVENDQDEVSLLIDEGDAKRAIVRIIEANNW